MHGSIGPSAALALFENGGLTIWTHTQGAHPLRLTLAECLGMDPARLRLVQRRGPGTYGHNGADDAALDAALYRAKNPGPAGAAQIFPGAEEQQMGALRTRHGGGDARKPRPRPTHHRLVA